MNTVNCARCGNSFSYGTGIFDTPPRLSGWSGGRLCSVCAAAEDAEQRHREQLKAFTEAEQRRQSEMREEQRRLDDERRRDEQQRTDAERRRDEQRRIDDERRREEQLRTDAANEWSENATNASGRYEVPPPWVVEEGLENSWQRYLIDNPSSDFHTYLKRTKLDSDVQALLAKASQCFDAYLAIYDRKREVAAALSLLKENGVPHFPELKLLACIDDLLLEVVKIDPTCKSHRQLQIEVRGKIETVALLARRPVETERMLQKFRVQKAEELRQALLNGKRRSQEVAVLKHFQGSSTSSEATKTAARKILNDCHTALRLNGVLDSEDVRTRASAKHTLMKLIGEWPNDLVFLAMLVWRLRSIQEVDSTFSDHLELLALLEKGVSDIVGAWLQNGRKQDVDDYIRFEEIWERTNRLKNEQLNERHGDAAS